MLLYDSFDAMLFTKQNWKLFGVLLLLSLVASAVMMMALAEVHEHFGQPQMMNLDDAVQGEVHEDANPWLTRSMFALSWIGSPQVLCPVILVFAAVLWKRGLRHASIVWLIATCGAGMMVLLLKLHFRRIRPDLPWAFAHEPSYSFPSGHSVFAVVVYGTLTYIGWRHLPRLWQRVAAVAIATSLILGIGYSRIYLGVHFPSDVAAGYYVGAVWLGAVIGADWYVRRFRAARFATEPQFEPD
ncbi:MAG: phosphatase PAP2 family protein [Acidobacteriota bacterium]|nr:phosphatase PAP2 family protein [Acidobacteriota bacterium]